MPPVFTEAAQSGSCSRRWRGERSQQPIVDDHGSTDHALELIEFRRARCGPCHAYRAAHAQSGDGGLSIPEARASKAFVFASARAADRSASSMVTSN